MNASKSLCDRDKVQAFQESVALCQKRLFRLTYDGAECNPFSGFGGFQDLQQSLSANRELAFELKSRIEPSLNVLQTAFEYHIAKIPTGYSMANVWQQWLSELGSRDTDYLHLHFRGEVLNVGEFLTDSDSELGLDGSRLSIRALSVDELRTVLKSDYSKVEQINRKLGLPFDDYENDRRIELGVNPETSPLLARYEKVKLAKLPSHDCIVACIAGCKAGEMRRLIADHFDFELWNQIWKDLDDAAKLLNNIPKELSVEERESLAIAKLIQDRSLTQKQIAEELGISVRSLLRMPQFKAAWKSANAKEGIHGFQASNGVVDVEI